MKEVLIRLAVCVAVVSVAASCATRGACPQASVPCNRPADAVQFKGHWYKVFDEKLEWHEAKKRCETMGGYLACIETKEEQAFITKLADGRYLCLGATDEQKEDCWMWVNGAPFTYECWMSGQPNNYGGDENYLATYDGGDWVDVAAEGGGFWMPTGFICEWDR